MARTHVVAARSSLALVYHFDAIAARRSTQPTTVKRARDGGAPPVVLRRDMDNVEAGLASE